MQEKCFTTHKKHSSCINFKYFHSTSYSNFVKKRVPGVYLNSKFFFPLRKRKEASILIEMRTFEQLILTYLIQIKKIYIF